MAFLSLKQFLVAALALAAVSGRHAIPECIPAMLFRIPQAAVPPCSVSYSRHRLSDVLVNVGADTDEHHLAT
ncbi:hypothetical protein DAEQUDRAFT_768935 [Daedalea quercina L-15889]|uniref:Uncharacterized protein n=1 Tax=Daedalea quercina L-15889 TaxID=1314783 RepID=A0A165M8S0_9APHY|nr:hypothetical protein DAEQUDRAFT_768935 [Daedalea quercina L-15889]